MSRQTEFAVMCGFAPAGGCQREGTLVEWCGNELRSMLHRCWPAKISKRCASSYNSGVGMWHVRPPLLPVPFLPPLILCNLAISVTSHHFHPGIVLI